MKPWEQAADDRETDEIFSRDSTVAPDQPCLKCGKTVPGDNALAVWVRNGPRYSPFCDVFEHDEYYQPDDTQNELRKANKPVALALDEE